MDGVRTGSRGTQEELEARLEAQARELRARDEELAGLRRQLHHQQVRALEQERLASLGALSAGIAHELKNPLNFINNFAQLCAGLSDELAASMASQRERLAPEVLAELDDTLGALRQNVLRIHEHGRRANQIINGMLAHARGGSGAPEPTDLPALLDESIHLAYHGMRGRSADFRPGIHTAYDPALGPVSLVAAELGRVFINLVHNACQAMLEKRRVLGEGYAPRLDVSTRDRGERVEVRIRDNGTGIPAAHLGRVFEPFYTTKPPEEGTGLGLAICHELIVGKYRGALRLESVEGEFTEVILELPKGAASAS
jgi:signal transduction histidine kinase